jgi:asparagine synthase (glutamine-hydrolysing)
LGIKIASFYRRLPKLARSNIPACVNLISLPFRGRIKYMLNHIVNVSNTANLEFNQRMLYKIVYTDFKYIKALTSPIKNVIKVEDFFRDFMSKCKYEDDFYKLMYMNFKHNLPDDYLVKLDRMSMAHSLEARIPFLDHRLIEFMCRVDKKVKMQGWERKSVLRKTVGRQLPPSILKTPKKGFGVPLREWFKDNSFNTRLNMLKSKGLPLESKMVEKIIANNKAGISDNGNFIWNLFVLKELLK